MGALGRRQGVQRGEHSAQAAADLPAEQFGGRQGKGGPHRLLGGEYSDHQFVVPRLHGAAHRLAAQLGLEPMGAAFVGGHDQGGGLGIGEHIVQRTAHQVQLEPGP